LDTLKSSQLMLVIDLHTQKSYG